MDNQERQGIHKFIWQYPWTLVVAGIILSPSIVGFILVPAGLKVMYDKHKSK